MVYSKVQDSFSYILMLDILGRLHFPQLDILTDIIFRTVIFFQEGSIFQSSIFLDGSMFKIEGF